jgi:plastocyanin
MPLFRIAAAAMILAVPAVAQPAAVTIDVQSFSFAPTPIHLRAGQPVTLTFINRSGSHDFTAAKFFAASHILAGSAPDGEIELPPHATRSITLVPRAGSYQAHCSHFMHKQMGMHDVILVD